MTPNNFVLPVALVFAAVFAHAVNADLKPLPPLASSTAAAPWGASEKDVCGEWMDKDFKYWEIRFKFDLSRTTLSTLITVTMVG